MFSSPFTTIERTMHLSRIDHSPTILPTIASELSQNRWHERISHLALSIIREMAHRSMQSFHQVHRYIQRMSSTLERKLLCFAHRTSLPLRSRLFSGTVQRMVMNSSSPLHEGEIRAIQDLLSDPLFAQKISWRGNVPPSPAELAHLLPIDVAHFDELILNSLPQLGDITAEMGEKLLFALFQANNRPSFQLQVLAKLCQRYPVIPEWISGTNSVLFLLMMKRFGRTLEERSDQWLSQCMRSYNLSPEETTSLPQFEGKEVVEAAFTDFQEMIVKDNSLVDKLEGAHSLNEEEKTYRQKHQNRLYMMAWVSQRWNGAAACWRLRADFTKYLHQSYHGLLLDKMESARALSSGNGSSSSILQMIDPLSTIKELPHLSIPLLQEIDERIIQPLQRLASDDFFFLLPHRADHPIHQRLRALHRGELHRLLIPCVAGNHGMLLLLEKVEDGTVSAHLYNSGDGIDHHQNRDGRYLQVQSYRRLPTAMLVDEERWNHFFNPINKRSVDTLYRFLDEELFSESVRQQNEEDPTLFRKPQGTGSCAVRRTIAFFHHQCALLAQRHGIPADALFKLIMATYQSSFHDHYAPLLSEEMKGQAATKLTKAAEETRLFSMVEDPSSWDREWEGLEQTATDLGVERCPLPIAQTIWDRYHSYRSRSKEIIANYLAATPRKITFTKELPNYLLARIRHLAHKVQFIPPSG